MDESRVMRGTYSDFKLVKTRNVIQMVIEFPQEQGQEFTQKFGLPSFASEQYVAVAMLQEVPRVEQGQNKIVQLAGVLCNNPEFGAFLKDKFQLNSIDVHDGESVASALRTICGMASRRELATNIEAQTVFMRLQSEYVQTRI